MKRLLLLMACAGFLGTTAVEALAQQRLPQPAMEALRAEVRDRAVAGDPLLEHRTRAVPGGRLDVDRNVLRAAYRLDVSVPTGSSSAVAGSAVLSAVAPQFGWTAVAADLQLVRVQQGQRSSHLTYQQVFHGVPVYRRQVKVNLDAAGRPTMIVSGYAPQLTHVRSFDPRPSIGVEEAKQRVRGAFTREVQTGTPELVVYPAEPPKLAWRIPVFLEREASEWEVLLDAHTGEVILLLNITLHLSRRDKRGSFPGADGDARMPDRRPARDAHAVSTAMPVARAQGSGLVFDPDPLTTAGVDYGPPYVDAGDAAVPELNAQRLERPLFDITQGTDGLYRLEGPFVRIVGDPSIGGHAYSPPAESDPHAFRYGRDHPHFEAVMAYYHIDASQRYVQSLQLGRGIQDVPIRVNPHGLGDADDSFYLINKNAIAFGDGGIDDAEDADVIWHEYGHALLEGSAPGLYVSGEGQALHEGWSDYWAASYSRGLMEAGIVPNHDWRKVYTWDGNETWSGRRLDRQGAYPGDLTGNKYVDGLLWATTLMEIYDDLGRTVVDRLSLASHAYLVSPVTLQDAAEAMIQADIDYYSGAHVNVLIERLGNRGFVDAAAYGPVIVHEPLPHTERVGDELVVEVAVTATAAPLDRVSFVYGIDEAPSQVLVLQPAEENRYSGVFPLPDNPADIYYYVEAIDKLGTTTLLPAGAPEETYHFAVGPDTAPPQIVHEPIREVSLVAWPPQVSAEIHDNQAVDSAWVAFRIEYPDGSVRAEETFGLRLEDEHYVGTFPIPAGAVATGSRIYYYLVARDVAAAANETRLPETDFFSFEVTAEGVLAAFDFEGEQGITASGVWERGVPRYGLERAHSGENVWATRLERAYPDESQQSSLFLPPLNLNGLDEAYLVFWHWYDFEHSDEFEPEETSSEALWDGGNVKVSTDGGASWVVLEPVGGYNGELAGGNAMEGEPAFGGYSYGWRRVVVPLPVGATVHVRFDFGTDHGNDVTSLYYAGWYLDDVSIATELPVDQTPPVLLEAPPEELSGRAGEIPPPIALRSVDDTGVAAVRALYEVFRSGERERDTLRLAMSTVDLSSFAGRILPDQPLGAGDRIEYRLEIVDFDGNLTVYPVPEDPPLQIVYRNAVSISALENVRVTGLWQRDGSLWITGDVAEEAEVSSLVLEPFDLPANAGEIVFVLDHRYRLELGLGGNLKLSADGGRSWQPVEPEGGYRKVFEADASHAMEGEPVFGGSSGGIVESVFDLSAHAGRQVRLRIDFGATRSLDALEFWAIEQALIQYSTLDDTFEIPRELALHPNFPDPFGDNTTVSYTLPETLPVRLELFNVLGQRIAVLIDGEQPAGTHTITLSRGGLAGGLYLLRLSAGGVQRVERMIITGGR